MKRNQLHTITAGLVIAFSITASPVFADSSRAPALGWKVHEPNRFMVSGVLRHPDVHGVIKPIHAIIEARSDTDALVLFVKAAERDYPEYSLISTLASPVPPAATCQNSL